MRKIANLKHGFKFKKFGLNKADEKAFALNYDDSNWRDISIPHDWGIEGEFKEDNDPTYTTIVQDGITKPITHTGRTGALPIVGEGIYRTWFEIKEKESVTLEFDGIMCESSIYINGVKAGSCHFGYLSFEVDITDLVTSGKNLLVIHAKVYPESSRWYPGAGVYRNIRLVTKPKEHINYNGVWIKQISADVNSALFDIFIETNGTEGFNSIITDPKGKSIEIDSNINSATFTIEKPILWDINSPNLYSALIKTKSGDTVNVKFGARNIKFTGKGFYLNDKYLKMNGVCMHHDMGSIGAAVNITALKRQIELLKSMGVNALRTSHNPPSPELLDLCDEYGILVMDEFFDEWIMPKVPNGYSKHFEKHALKDLENVIKRDRNHPSVIMWSIGNEIHEQSAKDGWKLAKTLSDKVKETDPTRPTTAGCDRYPDCIENKIAFNVDILGLNYKPHTYKDIKANYPELMLLGSETASCISTRGVYDFPAEVNIGMPKNEELTVSDYGLSAPSWAYYAERELTAQKDNPSVLGEFIWTGFDYLGEPTPYYYEWPARSSYFGAIDLAGLPKNRCYLYRAAWTDTPTLHVFPHWNFEGREGEIVPIHIYTNYDEVELFINGISQGRKSHAKEGNEITNQLERFRLMWNDTVYFPGEIMAVAYKNGIEAEKKTIRTAGKPYKIELSAYYNKIPADGESINFITASILDKNGNLCPNADNRLTFTSSGSAFVYTTDAGDQRETETFLRSDKKALSGKLVATIKNNGNKGNVTVICKGEGLISGEISFRCV